MKQTPSHPTPRVAVCVKLDTLGDLILFAPALQTLQREWPDTRLVTVIRQGYEDLAARLAPGVEWLTTSLNPFLDAPDPKSADFSRLADRISGLKPDVVLAATSRRNWLEIALSARSGAARRIAAGEATDEFFATQLRLAFAIDAASAFTETVGLVADEPDWRANFRLVDACLGQSVARLAPSLSLSDADRSAVAPVLEQAGLEPGGYAICAAAGFANVALKTWPATHFASVIRHLHSRHGCRTLLVGGDNERAYLEQLAATVPGLCVVWTGREGTLVQLAALIQQARLFVGNDTGAMHLAGAVDVPVVAVFGGGTWPRFVPAAPRSVTVVQPLPCFGCGWDCAFGDAPCIGGIPVEAVTAAVDQALANSASTYADVVAVEPLSAETRTLMGKAARRYRESRTDHLARQHKLEELTALDREKDEEIEAKDAEIQSKERELKAKDQEILALKATCDEREQTLTRVDGHARALTTRVNQLEADYAALQNTLQSLPPTGKAAAEAINSQAVHIRNIETIVRNREQELAELRATIANRDAGLHDLEQAKHYGRLLAEKEAVIHSLQDACVQREELIRRLTAEATTPTAKAHKLWAAATAFVREKIGRPFDAWLFRAVVEEYWMQIGVLRHYDPKPLRWDDRLPGPRLPDATLPQIGIVTPSYGQERFIERTLQSVVGQHYPKLRYVVQDGGSKDRSMEIVARFADRLHHFESTKDKGQADAIVRGFRHITGALAPNDLMAWLNSDDLLGPGVLRYVAEYFAGHEDVDVVYGHRIIIDDDDRDVGRWIMPPHDPATLEWIDYVPQETMFWRKRAWDLVGGVDPSFQFALDWDLLARFQQAGCKMVRVPYFLGAFRVHAEQKTSQAIHTTGAEEMRRVRHRFHGEQQDNTANIERHARSARFWGAVTARLHEIGIRR
jgi:ADP-heptose:LPS heptosyltransferase/GT2 family glycosyltransferase